MRAIQINDNTASPNMPMIEAQRQASGVNAQSIFDDGTGVFPMYLELVYFRTLFLKQFDSPRMIFEITLFFRHTFRVKPTPHGRRADQ